MMHFTNPLLYFSLILLLNSTISFTQPAFEFSHETLALNDTLGGGYYSSAEWGDLDNDGDYDLLFMGLDGEDRFTKVFRNDGNDNFTEIETGLDDLCLGSIELGDYDNDGDLDIIIYGWDEHESFTKIYENLGDAGFIDINVNLPGVINGSVEWTDYDGDGDLDIFLTGEDAENELFNGLYQNTTGNVNSSPQIPTNLISTVNGNEAVVQWDESTDAETDAKGISYNLYLKKDDQLIKPSHAYSNGDLKILKSGNNDQSTKTHFRNLRDGEYKWSIQSIDQSFHSSPFAQENTCIIENFQDSSPDTIPGLSRGSMDWADFNNDGNRDVIISGLLKQSDGTEIPKTMIFINHGNNDFEELDTDVIDVYQSAVAWKDFNNDGFIDFAICGRLNSEEYASKIYKNTGNDFIEIDADLATVYNGHISWADYDNDGDEDLLIMGYDAFNLPNLKTILYSNEGNDIFVENSNVKLEYGLPPTPVLWGDYNIDGYPDIFTFVNSDLFI